MSGNRVRGSIGATLAALEDRGELRYERKFRLAALQAGEAEARVRLHHAAFREVYVDRRVHNLYFDTPDLRCFHDNVDGAGRRFKVRIRWYGEGLQESRRIERPALELKGRVGALGSKARFALPPLECGPGLGTATIRALIESADLPQAMKLELGMMRPVLLSEYRRRYYLASDRRFRLTIDRAMRFAGVDGEGPSLRPRSVGRSATGVVVELKYAQEASADLPHVIGELPFRVTRSSKYVSGMRALG